jgi:DNA-binding CsgD family transcriptional regulator
MEVIIHAVPPWRSTDAMPEAPIIKSDMAETMREIERCMNCKNADCIDCVGDARRERERRQYLERKGLSEPRQKLDRRAEQLHQAEQIYALIKAGLNQKEICERFRISRRTFFLRKKMINEKMA